MRAALTLLLLLPLGPLGCGQPGGPARVAPLEVAVAQAPRATVAAPLTVSANAPAPVARSAPAPVAREPEGTLDLRRALVVDPDPDARRAALDRWTDDARESDQLVRTLYTDPDPLVRRWAALALERVADRDLAPALRQAQVAERDAAVRSILGRIVRRLG